MTTESTERPRDPGMRVLGGATLAGLVVSALTTLVAALAGEPGAVAGAAVGGFSLTVVMAFGTFIVHVAANVVPSLSLLVAIMTYALQITLMVAFFLLLARSGELESSIDGAWLVGGVVVASLTWSAVQIWLSSRARIPLYDLSRGGESHRQEPGE